MFWLALIGLVVGATQSPGSPEKLKELVRTQWTSFAQADGAAAPTLAVQEKAAKVSGCEAGYGNKLGDKSLMDGTWGPSMGPFQIRTMWGHLRYWGRWAYDNGRKVPNRNPVLMLVPTFNAQAAYDISGGGRDWHLWTCGKA